MNDLAVIESYLLGQMPDAERVAFEARLHTDPNLADTLAFYLMAQQSAKAAANEQRRAEWDARRRTAMATPAGPRRLSTWVYAVAAAACLVLVVGFGWYFLNKPTAPELADAYIHNNLTMLSVTMGSRADSLQTGIQQYNTGNLAGAETTADALLRREPANADALKLAGLVALRRGNYDQAIDRFHRLSQRADLFDNPGTFYEALALLKRNRPADKNQARSLLNAVVANNLSGKADAENLVKLP